MNSKYVSFFAAVILAAAIFAGCAQDSTNTTDDNPEMQEAVMHGGATGGTAKSGSSSTNTTRSEASGGTSGNKLALSTDPSGALKYNTTKLNANAGNVTIALTNESAVPHDVAVEDSSGKKLGTSKEITKGSTTLKIKDLGPGTYTFFCTVPGHEQAGMKGTLTVR